MSTAFLAGLLGACSAIPDVEYSYYPPKSSAAVAITQTVACDQDNNFILVTTASFSPTYSADYNKGPYRISVRDIEGAFGGFADSDANFSFTDDGRLKSISQSTTGQGETIIKSALTLATTVAPFARALVKSPSSPSPQCQLISGWGGGKPVSLNYNINNLDLGAVLGKTLSIPVAPGSETFYDALKNKLPVLELRVSTPADIGGRARYLPSNSSGAEFVYLTLQQTAIVKIDITASSKVIWSGNVTVPLAGTYGLPIPKAALYGKQSFSLTLAESGAITAVDYGKNTGAAGVLKYASGEGHLVDHPRV